MKAVEAIKRLGVDDKRIDLLMPGADLKEFEQKADVLHEGTGTGAWAAMGAGIGSFAGAAFMTALIPGIGPILGIGAVAAAFVAGGFGGKVAGDAVENSNFHDDLRDDTHVLYDALRREKAVLIVGIDDKTDPENVASVLRASGGESFDEAREGWWRARRDAESAWYKAQGHGDFGHAEKLFRRGYEAGFDPAFAGRSFESVAVKLRTRFSDFDEGDFRRGYERAQQVAWNRQADASNSVTSQAAVASLPADKSERYSSPSHPGR